METNEDASRIKALSILFGAYGQAKDADRLAIYAGMLNGIPVVLLQSAVKKLLVTNKYLPSVSEIVESCEGLIGTVDDSVRIKTWDEAWDEIAHALQSTPWGKVPTFSSPEISEAVKNFGWHDLQSCRADDLPTVRAQMRRHYESVCDRMRANAKYNYAAGSGQCNILSVRVGAVTSANPALEAAVQALTAVMTMSSKSKVDDREV